MKIAAQIAVTLGGMRHLGLWGQVLAAHGMRSEDCLGCCSYCCKFWFKGQIGNNIAVANLCGRGGQNRTADLLVPNQALEDPAKNLDFEAKMTSETAPISHQPGDRILMPSSVCLPDYIGLPVRQVGRRVAAGHQFDKKSFDSLGPALDSTLDQHKRARKWLAPYSDGKASA